MNSCANPCSPPDRIPKTEILFQKKLVLAEGSPEEGMLLEAGKHRWAILKPSQLRYDHPLIRAVCQL